MSMVAESTSGRLSEKVTNNILGIVIVETKRITSHFQIIQLVNNNSNIKIKTIYLIDIKFPQCMMIAYRGCYAP